MRLMGQMYLYVVLFHILYIAQHVFSIFGALIDDKEPNKVTKMNKQQGKFRTTGVTWAN